MPILNQHHEEKKILVIISGPFIIFNEFILILMIVLELA